MNKMLVVFSLFSLSLILGLSSCTDTGEKNTSTVENLDSLIKLFPDSVPLLVKRGNKFLQAFEFEQALKDGARAFRLDSNNYQARLLYAQGQNNKYGRSLEDVNSAQRHYQVYLKRDPKSTEALVGLAATYGYMQDFDNAFKYINTALKVDPKYRDAYILKGSIYLVLGNRELAKSSYETAVQQDPNFFEAYLRLGDLYLDDSSKQCIEYYTTAHQLKPTNAEALYSLSYAKESFSDLAGARIGYREMSEIDSSKYYSARGFFHLGFLKDIYEKEIDSAIYYYEKAIEVEPGYVEAHHNLGVLFEDKGNIKTALDHWSIALKYNPEYELSRDAADRYRNWDGKK